MIGIEKFLILKMKNILNTIFKSKSTFNIFKTLNIIKPHINNNLWSFIIEFYKKKIVCNISML